MLPELGYFAIILAFAFALLQSMTPIWGIYRHQPFYFKVSTQAALGQCLLLSFALLCLMMSFLNNDITVLYVREHSQPLLPLLYRLGAIWGAHEGSLLLWCFILSAWTAAFILFSKKQLPEKSFITMISILGILSSGFIAFLLFTSNPFIRDFPDTLVASNDLTPILQDPGLIFHPPMLYSGYVGFVISFAFAITALIEGKLEPKRAAVWRPWVILPWSLLACGIVLGSWWAYRELGWGGWWFWDPVENASLLPWLAATGLIHSLIVSEKQSAFKGWTVLLALLTFALCLLGTFLVRSGVLVSVHAFANDPGRGIFLLSYLAFIIGSALLLYSIRSPNFFQSHSFQLCSRETLLLINSVVLLTLVVTIVIGTLYPILLDALNMGKLSVGEPYFNTVFVPIILPLLILMGAAPHVRWQEERIKRIWNKCRITLILSILCGFIGPPITGFPFYFLTSIGITLGCWIVFATLQSVYSLYHQQTLSLKYASMIVAHIGIGLLVLGIVLNKSYSTERQVRLAIGEETELSGYQYTLKNVDEAAGPNYQRLIATFNVQKNNQFIDTLTAEQRLYQDQQTLSKTGILVNPWRDLYVALGNAFSDGSWVVRIYYKPFVRWIWFGGVLLLLGGFLSLLHTYRESRRKCYEN